MIIKHLSVTNFKSFGSLSIAFNKLNIVIGANASGKSNFITLFNFLRNVTNYGLSNAISMEGGIAYLRNTRIGMSSDMHLSLSYDPEIKYPIEREDAQYIGIKMQEVAYEFALHFQQGAKGYKISKDQLKIRYEFVDLKKKKSDFEELKNLGIGEATFTVNNGKLRLDSSFPPNLEGSIDAIIPRFFLREPKFPQNKLLLESPLYELTHRFENPLGQIPIYDFDPKLPKRAVSITGKTELEENGSNLSIVLMNILQNREAKRRFLNLIKDLLPFINDFRVQKFADKSLLFTLREQYDEPSPYLPASLLSDGTVNIAALVIALYFEQKPLLIIEEPERNIHPHLISRFMSMLAEAAERQQIIVTTHNPEIVKHAATENLLLISRDKQGFSTICRPSESKEIQLFLKDELGIAELYIQDLLGVKCE